MQRFKKFPPLMNTFVGGFLYISRLQSSIMISFIYLGYGLIRICIFSFNWRFGIITVAWLFGSNEMFCFQFGLIFEENNKVIVLVVCV